VCGFDARGVLRSRADSLGPFQGDEIQALGREVALTRGFCREDGARLATADAEVRWLESRSVTPEAYFKGLDGATDRGRTTGVANEGQSTWTACPT
jgi:hypothetical protein